MKPPGLYDGVDMTKLMFGQHAVHVPAWIVCQGPGSPIAFIGSSRDVRLQFSAPETHVLVVGEIIVRPHLLVASDAFRGYGLEGLLHTDKQEFVENGRIMFAMEDR